MECKELRYELRDEYLGLLLTGLLWGSIPIAEEIKPLITWLPIDMDLTTLGQRYINMNKSDRMSGIARAVKCRLS